MSARRAAGLALLLLAGLAACTAGTLTGNPVTSPPPPGPSVPQYPSVPPPAEQSYKVDSVYDGDTLRVFLPDGTSQPVRVLGINAPEMRAPVPPEDLDRSDAPAPGPECGAEEARTVARELLQGKSVQLTQDPAQGDKDAYGRLLRYVQVDGRDLAEALLHSGWVQVYERYPVARTPHYLNVQANARAAESGGWAMCGWEN